MSWDDSMLSDQEIAEERAKIRRRSNRATETDWRVILTALDEYKACTEAEVADNHDSRHTLDEIAHARTIVLERLP